MYQIVRRKDALLHGKLRYFTGVMCRNGHDCQRYASNGACVECVRPSKRNTVQKLATHRTVRLTLRVPVHATDEQISRLSTWIDRDCLPAFFKSEHERAAS